MPLARDASVVHACPTRRRWDHPLALLLLPAGFAITGLAACTALKAGDPAAAETDAASGDPLDDEEARDASSGAADGGNGATDAAPDAPKGASNICTEATCPPVTVQANLYGPIDVAVNATHVYWIEVGSTIPQGNSYGQLIRLPKASTCAQRSCFEVLDYTALSGELEGKYIYGTRIALGLHDVCYTQSYNASPGHSIRCFAVADPVKRALDTGVGEVVDLWVGATDARWVVTSSSAAVADGEVQGRPLDGGTVTVLVPDRVRPSAVTSDGSRIYWSELGGSAATGGVHVRRPDGGTAPIATGRALPVSARLFGQHVYWIDAGARKVLRGRTDGVGAPEQIATTDEKPFALVVDASGVYWASAGTGASGLYGSVAHAPLTPGGAITTMIGNIDKVAAIATDATSVYVASVGTNLDAGKIVRIAKTRP